MTLAERSGPICWAQQVFWVLQASGNQEERFVVAHLGPLDVSLWTLREKLTQLARRHEVLRTVYTMDVDGKPIQRVLPVADPAMTVVEIQDVPSDWDPLALAEHLPRKLDPSKEPPFHSIAGTVNGTVKYALLGAHPLALDGVSSALMRADLSKLLLGGADTEPSHRSSTWQPVDQAILESSSELQPANDAAMRYWRRVLAAAPHSTLPFYWHDLGRDTSRLQTILVSRRLASLCRGALHKYQGTLPTLMLAILSILLVSWTGHRSCAVGVANANRWSSQLESSLGRYSTLVKLHTDLGGDPPFSEILRRTWSAAVSAYGNSRHNMGELVMLEALESLQTGLPIVMAVAVDYHEYPLAGALPMLPLEPRTDPQLLQFPDDTGSPAHVKIDLYPADDSAIAIGLGCPTSLLSQDAARAFMRQLYGLVEAILVDGDPRLSELAAQVDLPACWKAPDWLSVRQTWINLADVAELLARHDEVDAAAAFPLVNDAASEPALVGYVASRNARLTPEGIHEHMRDLVSGFPTTMLPSRYVISAAAPSDVSDRDAWLALPTITAGTGRLDGPAEPSGPAEEALAKAFSDFHPRKPVRMGHSYSELGGEFLLIPAVLDHLDRLGFGRLHFGDFIGLASMRRLAKKLRR